MNPCPDLEQLDRMCRGHAAADIAAACALHLAECADCRAVAAELRANLAAAARWEAGRWGSASEALAEPQPEIAGITLTQRLSAGGQGVVWRGRHDATQRPVAVKILRSNADPAARARFAREARLGASLRHPHLVTVLDAGETTAGALYLVMELVDGVTLEEARQRGVPTVAAALRCFVQLADGVRFAHQHGVLHRDLKPSNILLTAAGDVRILDFGLAKALEVAVDPTTTAEGTFVGTLACAAPEQLRFDGVPLDVRTDLFQLGVVFYRYLTGAWPHEPVPDPRAMLGKRLHDVPARPSRRCANLPPDVDTVLLRLLAPEPERRYGSANELADDLARIGRGEPIAARADEARVRLARLVARYRVSLVAAGVVVAVLGVAIWLVLGFARQAEADRASIAREHARAEELLAIVERALDAFGAGPAGPKTPMVDFLDRIVAELDALPTGDARGRADLLLRAADVYARIADPERAAAFVARAVTVLGTSVEPAVELELRARELRLRASGPVLDPELVPQLDRLVVEIERRLGADSAPALRLTITLQMLRANNAQPEARAALAVLAQLPARIAVLPTEGLRAELLGQLEYAAVAVAAAAGEREEALRRGRALLATPVGTSYAERVRRFAILQVVSPMALDVGDLALADTTTAELVTLAADVALELDPRRAAAAFTRGVCLMRLQQGEAAAVQFREFLALVDRGVRCEPRRVALACVWLAGQGESDRPVAVELLGRARLALREVGPAASDDLLQVEFSLGGLLVQTGRGSEAAALLREARDRAIERHGAGSKRVAEFDALLDRLPAK